MYNKIKHKIYDLIIDVYRSFVARHEIKQLDISRDKVLLFIGAPRTGSTFLGQILNCHPECLIASESRLIQHVILEGEPFEKELEQTIRMAYKHFRWGLKNDPGYGRSLKRFQGKWKSIEVSGDRDLYAKRGVRVVGDKKAGGSAQSYLSDKSGMVHLANTRPELYFIQIVRSPVDSSLSYLKSHPHEVREYNEAFRRIVSLQCGAQEFLTRIDNPRLVLYYEDLLSNPKSELRKICDWLNLTTSEEWLEEQASVVNEDGRNRDYDSEVLTQSKKILQEIGCDVFIRYDI